MDEIANTLAIMVGENYITRFNWHDRSYDVITQVPQTARDTPDELGRFYVKTAGGPLLPLSTVVRISMRRWSGWESPAPLCIVETSSQITRSPTRQRW